MVPRKKAKPRVVAKRNELLSLLGLARRANALSTGAEECRRAIRNGVARVVVMAGDASPAQRTKVEALAKAREVPVLVVESRMALGHAVGEPPLTAVAVTQATLAARVLAVGSDPSSNRDDGSI